MRLPVNSLIAELRRTADAAREGQAAELYGEEALRAAMVAAAAKGFDHATIPGPVGLDLRETAAVDTARTWLAGQKIGVEFQPRTGTAGIEAAGTYDLVLTWKEPVKA